MDGDLLTDQFEASRSQLRAVAYRMLGSLAEADDIVQEAWLRLNRADTTEVDNLGGWLTTVVTRLCLDVLRSRRSRGVDDLIGDDLPATPGGGATEPEQEALLADSVGLALLVVLERLAPPERVAFVLHDMFAVPFDEIAEIMDRSPTAARQLASRARRRVHGVDTTGDTDVIGHRQLVDSFLAASRGGDLDALLAALDPDVVLRADATAVRAGSSPQIRGAQAVAEQFVGRAVLARSALIDGSVGIVVAPQGRLRLALALTITDGTIAAIEVIADPQRLGQLDLAVADA